MKITLYDKSKSKPTRFYFRVSKSPKRGYDVRVIVFYIKTGGEPRHIGYADANIAAFIGERAAALNVISQAVGYEMKDRYRLKRQNVKLFQIY